MDNDDDYRKMLEEEDMGKIDSSQYYDYEQDAESDIDYDECEVQYYDELEKTQRAHADINTIKESIMGLKKVVFTKNSGIQRRYDEKLVLKSFIKEQHRELSRLDLYSHADQFKDLATGFYSLIEIQNFVRENARLKMQQQSILKHVDLNEYIPPFSCRSTKLDEYIKRIDMKKFQELFKNACDLDFKKKKTIYDLVDWRLLKKNEDQLKVHRTNSLLKNIRKGLAAGIANQLDQQKSIQKTKKGKEQPIKTAFLVKLLAKKFNIKTKCIRMDVVGTRGSIYLVQTHNTNGRLCIIIYNFLDDELDFKNAKEIELSRSVNPKIFDVTNKVFKEHNNCIYFFVVYDDMVILKNINMTNGIISTVNHHNKLKSPDLQAVLFCHDKKHFKYENEQEWLNHQNYGIITKNGNFDVINFKNMQSDPKMTPDIQLVSFNAKKAPSNIFKNNNQFLFLLQDWVNGINITFSQPDDEPPTIYRNKRETKTGVDSFKEEATSFQINFNHQIIYIDGPWKYSKPLLNRKLLNIQETIFKKKIEDETIDQQYIVHLNHKKRSYLIGCDSSQVELRGIVYKAQDQPQIKDMSYFQTHINDVENPLETMFTAARQRGVVAVQMSSQFNNIFMTPGREQIYEVAKDEMGKNKINEYKCSHIDKTEFRIEYVFPFYHIFEDLNIPNIAEGSTSLHNFHMCENIDLMKFNWPLFGSDTPLPPRQYLQLAKSARVTYHKKGRYMRNFQVAQRFVCHDLQYQWFSIKEFQFVIKGEESHISQIGQKLVIMNFNCNCDIEFVPLYKNNTACIIGTQLIIKHKQNNNQGRIMPEIKRIFLENFKETDYQFSNRLASCGYMRITHDGINQDAMLIIDCRLEKEIRNIDRKGFQLDYNERDLVIKTSLKAVLNMIPSMNVFQFTQKGPKNEKEFDFFQPQEYLKGKCRANYYSRNEKEMYNQIYMINNNLINKNSLQDSFIQQFVKNTIYDKLSIDEMVDNSDLNKRVMESSLLESLSQQGWIRQQFEIQTDLSIQNVIEDALNFEKNELVFKMLFDQAYKQNTNKEIYDTFSRVLYIVFQSRPTFADCVIKFINDNGEVKGNFSIALPLDNTDLPKFSSEEHSLAEYDITNQGITINQTDQAIKLEEDQIKEKITEQRKKECEMIQQFVHYPYDYNKYEFLGIHKQFKADFSPLGIIPVSHFIIDFRSILFNEKLMILKGLRHADTKVQFTEFDFAKLIFNINKKFTNAIENQNCVRALIDFQFEKTRQFYHKLFMSYIIFHALPFFFQLLFIYDPLYIRMCLFSCSIRQCISTMVEGIQIKMIGVKYFLSIEEHQRCRVGYPIISNILKLLMLFTFFIYTYFEFKTPHTTLGSRTEFQPEVYQHGLSDYDKMMNIFIMFIILEIVLQCNYFMQVYESFGLLRQLIIICLVDMVPFTMYMIMFLIMFSMFYKTLGVNISQNNYPGMNDFGMFFFNTLENTLGNVQNPDVSIWHSSDNPSQGFISLIYVVWLLNQFLTTIVLMNFLIAVISQSYENVMNKLQVHTYKNRASMNFQYYQIMEFYQNSKKLTLVLLQSKSQGMDGEAGDGDEWKGFVQTLKRFLRQKLNPLDEKVSNINKYIDGLKTQVDTVKRQLFDIKKGQEEMENMIKKLINAQNK